MGSMAPGDLSDPPLPAPGAGVADVPARDPGPKIFSVGTLRYTRAALFILFFYLMWNDLILMLMEQVQGLIPILLKNHGASNAEISLLGTFLVLLTMIINPVVSTWSDRTRTRYGRRRPFLAIATPPCAIFLTLIPWAPNLFHAASAIAWVQRIFAQHQALGVCIFVGMVWAAFAAFNSTLLAIFSYYYWDVVPEPVLARFYSLSKIVSTLAAVLWNMFLLGLADKHMKALFAGVAAVFAVLYLLTVWRVKEGDYPPAPPRKSGLVAGFTRATVGYLQDCFSRKRYLLVFGTFMVYQLSNAANGFQIFLYHYQMHMKLGTIGPILAIPPLIAAGLAYPLGAFLDRVGAVRAMAPLTLLWGAANLGAFFFLHNRLTMLIFLSAINIMIAAWSIAVSVLTVEVYPRAKLGQFCSASVLAQSIFCMILAPLAGVMLDHVHNYQYSFLWPAVGEFMAAGGFFLIYRSWRKGVYRNT